MYRDAVVVRISIHFVWKQGNSVSNTLTSDLQDLSIGIPTLKVGGPETATGDYVCSFGTFAREDCSLFSASKGPISIVCPPIVWIVWYPDSPGILASGVPFTLGSP